METCSLVKKENGSLRLDYTPSNNQNLRNWYDLNGLKPEIKTSMITSWEQVLNNPGDMFTVAIKRSNVMQNFIENTFTPIASASTNFLFYGVEHGFTELSVLFRAKMIKDVVLNFILSEDFSEETCDLKTKFNYSLAKLCMWKEFCHSLLGINATILIWKETIPTHVDMIMLIDSPANYQHLSNACLNPTGTLCMVNGNEILVAIKQPNPYAWMLYNKSITQAKLQYDLVDEINDTYFNDLFGKTVYSGWTFSSLFHSSLTDMYNDFLNWVST
jgi:hypothetical protein